MKHYLKATFTLESIFPDSLTIRKLQIPNSLHGDTRRAQGPSYLVPGLIGLSGFVPLNRVFEYGGPEGSHIQIKNVAAN